MLSLIVAYDENRGIGKNNELPWHYPEDLQYFKKVTSGHTVAMGRNTFLSIGKALPQRKNIVFTSDKNSLQDFTNIEVETNPVVFFEKNEHTLEEIFVIGGRKIYDLALPYVKRLYITEIARTFDVDTYFPNIDLKNFTKKFTETKGELMFVIYEKGE